MKIVGIVGGVASGKSTVAEIFREHGATVISADEILVLERGEVVERGNHTELLALDNVYAHMWQRQQEAQKAEETLQQTLEDNLLAASSRAPAAAG